MNTEDKMHGSIFVLLKRFVENFYDYSTWMKLLDAVGHTGAPYQLHEVYPTSEIVAILERASALTGIPVYELTERFGEFLVPDLLMVYKKYVDPKWRTYEMLLNAEEKMHRAVKREDDRTTPPLLLVTKVGNKQLMVDYYSKRRMSGVAVGIIKGIAAYYHESDRVVVSRLTASGEERVQIRVDFLE